MSETKTEWRDDHPTVLAVRNLLESMAKCGADLAAVFPYGDISVNEEHAEKMAYKRRVYESSLIEAKLPLLAQNLGYRLVRIEE